MPEDEKKRILAHWQKQRDESKRRESLARTAGILCGNPRFQEFIGVTNAEAAAAYVRRICKVSSRRELDSDKDAAKRFHEIRRMFAYGEGSQ